MSYSNTIRTALEKYSTRDKDAVTHLDLGNGMYAAGGLKGERDILNCIAKAYAFGEPYTIVEKRTEFFPFCIDLDFSSVATDMPRDHWMEYVRLTQQAVQMVGPNPELLKCYVSHTTVPLSHRKKSKPLFKPSTPLTMYVEQHLEERASHTADVADMCRQACLESGSEDNGSAETALKRSRSSSSSGANAKDRLLPAPRSRRSFVKQGIHLVWPDMIVTCDIAMWIRAVIIHALSVHYPLFVPHVTNAGNPVPGVFDNVWETVVDEKIYTANGLRMNGASKTDECPHCQNDRKLERKEKNKLRTQFTREKAAYDKAMTNKENMTEQELAALKEPRRQRAPQSVFCQACKTTDGKTLVPGCYQITCVLNAWGEEDPVELHELKSDPAAEIVRTSIRRPQATAADVSTLVKLSVPKDWNPAAFAENKTATHNSHPQQRARSKVCTSRSMEDALDPDSENRKRVFNGSCVVLDRDKEKHCAAIDAIAELMDADCVTSKLGHALETHCIKFFPAAVKYEVELAGKHQRCLLKAAKTGDPEAFHSNNRTKMIVMGASSLVRQWCFNEDCKGSVGYANVCKLNAYFRSILFDNPPEGIPPGAKRSSSVIPQASSLRATVNLGGDQAGGSVGSTPVSTPSSTPCGTPRLTLTMPVAAPKDALSDFLNLAGRRDRSFPAAAAAPPTLAPPAPAAPAAPAAPPAKGKGKAGSAAPRAAKGPFVPSLAPSRFFSGAPGPGSAPPASSGTAPPGTAKKRKRPPPPLTSDMGI